MTIFSFTPEEKKPEKRKPVKQTFVETIGGRNVFLEDGDMLVLEDHPFRMSLAGRCLTTVALLASIAYSCLVIAKYWGHHVTIHLEMPVSAFMLVLRVYLPQSDRIFLEMRDQDVYCGDMRLGRPKNVRYTLGRTLLGYTIFVWDDGKRPPKRPLYASYSRSNVDRMAALIDRFLGRGPAPEPEQIEWPPAPIRQAVPLSADAGEAP